MKTKDFKPGDRVVYIPTHVYDDFNHEDCERGVVSSINDKYVFVKFVDHMPNAQACNPENLMMESEVDFINGI